MRGRSAHRQHGQRVRLRPGDGRAVAATRRAGGDPDLRHDGPPLARDHRQLGFSRGVKGVMEALNSDDGGHPKVRAGAVSDTIASPGARSAHAEIVSRSDARASADVEAWSGSGMTRVPSADPVGSRRTRARTRRCAKRQRSRPFLDDDSPLTATHRPHSEALSAGMSGPSSDSAAARREPGAFDDSELRCGFVRDPSSAFSHDTPATQTSGPETSASTAQTTLIGASTSVTRGRVSL